MRKPGTDNDNVQMSDVICDFCRGEWTDDLQMVEGHQGSTICGTCLAEAYRSVLLRKEGSELSGSKCVLCLENRAEAAWRSAAHPEAVICKRCTNQSAAVLAKDKELGWVKPRE